MSVLEKLEGDVSGHEAGDSGNEDELVGHGVRVGVIVAGMGMMDRYEPRLLHSLHSTTDNL